MRELEDALTDEIKQTCSDFHQGSMFEIASIPVLSSAGIIDVPTGAGIVIVSQTCDIVQDTKHAVLVAPIVILDSNKAGSAKKGYMPQYVHLDNVDQQDLFADLNHCATLTKAQLASLRVFGSGVNQNSSGSISRFASRVGRKFSRFPFPDEVQPWFRPLQELIRSKHGKQNALGSLLSSAVTIRLSADNWNESGRNLTLHIIGENDSIPSPEETSTSWEWANSTLLAERSHPEGWTLTELADQIIALPTGYSNERLALWSYFGEKLASVCKPKDIETQPDEVKSAIDNITFELYNEEDFSLYTMNRSESLDLDYLSNSGA